MKQASYIAFLIKSGGSIHILIRIDAIHDDDDNLDVNARIDENKFFIFQNGGRAVFDRMLILSHWTLTF